MTVHDLIIKLLDFPSTWEVEVVVEARYENDAFGDMDISYSIKADSIIETKEGENCVEIRV